MLRHKQRVAVAAAALIALIGTAQIWTRSAYNDNVEQVLAKLADTSQPAIRVSRSVANDSLLGQTETLRFFVEIDPVNGEQFELVVTSRVLFLSAVVTGDLHVEMPIGGVEKLVAGLDIDIDRDAGRWWFNAFSGKTDITYHSPQITLKSAGAEPFELTVEPTKLVANLYGDERGFSYRGAWRGMHGSFPQGGTVEIRGSVFKGAGRFDTEPTYQWHYGFIKSINATFPGGSLSIAELRMRGRQRDSQGYLDLKGLFSSGAISSRVPGASFDIDGCAIDYRVHHLHADSYDELVALSQAPTPADDDEVEAALLKLASHGITVRLKELRLRHDDTESSVKGHFDVARPDVGVTTLDELKPYLGARLELDVSDKLLGSRELAAALLGGLIEQGLLQHDEQGRITLRAAIDAGTLTLNGNTQPL